MRKNLKGTKIFRAAIWSVCMMLLAYLLGIEWNWRILALCILSSFIDEIVYADYSAVRRKSTADRT